MISVASLIGWLLLFGSFALMILLVMIVLGIDMVISAPETRGKSGQTEQFKIFRPLRTPDHENHRFNRLRLRRSG